GATSFLYSPLLVIGHLIGFRELNLAIWALWIGSLAFLFSAWLIYRLIVDAYPAPNRLQSAVAIILTLAFVSSGPFIWASFSGMEAALFIMAILLALYCYSHTVQPLFATEPLVIDHAAIKRYAIPGTVLVALIRPEGAVVALSMVV